MSVYGGPFADGKQKRTYVGRNGKVQRSNFGNHYHFNNKPNGLLHWARALKNARCESLHVIIHSPVA